MSNRKFHDEISQTPQLQLTEMAALHLRVIWSPRRRVMYCSGPGGFGGYIAQSHICAL